MKKENNHFVLCLFGILPVVWLGLLILLGNPAAGRCVNFLLGAGWYRLLSEWRTHKKSPVKE